MLSLGIHKNKNFGNLIAKLLKEIVFFYKNDTRINKLSTKEIKIDDKNNCLFLDENKIQRKFNIIFPKLSELHNLPKKEQYAEIQKAKKNFKKIKLLELYNDNPDKKYLIESMKKQIIKKIKNDKFNSIDLTIGDLDTYFNKIINDLYSTNIKEYLNTYYDIEDNETKLTQLTDILKNFDLEVDKLEIKVPFSYIFLNKAYYHYDTKDKIEFNDYHSLDFEQSDIIYSPNIKIFCTNLENSNIKSNIFNLFTIMHELGHTFSTIENKNIKINNEKYFIPSLMSSQDIFNSIINELNEEDKIILTKLRYSEILNFNSPSQFYIKILDMLSDIIATNYVIKYLKKQNISNSDILKYMIGIYNKLSGDAYHFNKNIRIILNIFINSTLKNALQEEYENNKIPDNSSDIENILKKIKTYYNNDETINAINNIIKNKIMYTENNIFNEHIKKIKIILDENKFEKQKDNIEEFLLDAETLYFDDDPYFKKYLKYKNKYLKLKN